MIVIPVIFPGGSGKLHNEEFISAGSSLNFAHFILGTLFHTTPEKLHKATRPCFLHRGVGWCPINKKNQSTILPIITVSA